MGFLHWFISLFWIGACAVALLWQTGLLVSGVYPSGWLSGFVFGATAFGYHFSAPGSRRLPAWVLGFGGAYCFLYLDVGQQAAVAFPSLIWWMYYDRRRPGQGTGLRYFPVLKPIAIALAWAWVTVFLPLPATLWTSSAILFVGRAAFIFALALAYDLCDRPEDRRQGLPTLALRLGPGRTFRLIHGALGFSGLCVLVNTSLGIFGWSEAARLIVALLISAAVLPAIIPRVSWGEWRKSAIDGLMMFQFALVWIMR